MKKLIFIFVLVISFSAQSQTFIGKTEDEILAFTKKNEYKLESTDSDANFHFHSVMYSDPKFPIHYLFYYGKDNKCMTYSIWTQDKSTMASIEKDIENKSEKLSSNLWVQKIDGKAYTWDRQGGDASSSFVMTEFKK